MEKLLPVRILALVKEIVKNTAAQLVEAKKLKTPDDL